MSEIKLIPLVARRDIKSIESIRSISSVEQIKSVPRFTGYIITYYPPRRKSKVPERTNNMLVEMIRKIGEKLFK